MPLLRPPAGETANAAPPTPALNGGIDGVTTGASNDIERATQMARNMVTKWGLNEKMGPVLYGEDDSQAPGGGNVHYSEDTLSLIHI